MTKELMPTAAIAVTAGLADSMSSLRMPPSLRVTMKTS